MKYESLNPKFFALWMQYDDDDDGAAACMHASHKGILCMLERKKNQ